MSGRTVGQRLESSEITSSSCLRPDHAMYFAQVASVLSNFAVATNQGIIGVRALIVPKIVPRKSQVPISRVTGDVVFADFTSPVSAFTRVENNYAGAWLA